MTGGVTIPCAGGGLAAGASSTSAGAAASCASASSAFELGELVGVLLAARGQLGELRLERIEPGEHVGQRAARRRADRLRRALALRRGVDLGREIAAVAAREHRALQRFELAFDLAQSRIVLRRRGLRQRDRAQSRQQQCSDRLTPDARHGLQFLPFDAMRRERAGRPANRG